VSRLLADKVIVKVPGETVNGVYVPSHFKVTK